MAPNGPRTGTAPGQPQAGSVPLQEGLKTARLWQSLPASPKPPFTPELASMLPKGFPQPPQRLPDSAFGVAAVLPALRHMWKRHPGLGPRYPPTYRPPAALPTIHLPTTSRPTYLRTFLPTYVRTVCGRPFFEAVVVVHARRVRAFLPDHRRIPSEPEGAVQSGCANPDKARRTTAAHVRRYGASPSTAAHVRRYCGTRPTAAHVRR